MTVVTIKSMSRYSNISIFCVLSKMTESSVYHDDVPGTVRLVDINGMNSSGPHDSQHKDIVLVPRPSSDPNDPLNWSHRRKLLAVSMSYLYVLGTGIATSLQYSVLADITK